ncbi:hypothetical protein Dsui_3277 [Azospira oryzae PS]|uniref:Bacteriophage T5 Orf172 DNA-binding domain-containing protein n=1 Tax=Azospira oryzae (strain ATCC BAA-33 / DSM 13638 / PS) TaxID=640081 RepID=G8QJD9_AZOOP|nr:GIY-YIG nuclease family protein [Azospira oryzae]AEV27608.1 hypothetical protein Dsui_3277 [Azospira oryzae PS]
MAETTNLYLLIFPERGIIKIGKADDIHNRIQTLRRWWGEADYEASYYLRAPLEVIFKLEKSLHFFLSQYSVPFEEGDGRTELFSADALGVALKHIDLYSSSAPDIEGVKKGVPRPLLASPLPRRRGKHRGLIRKSKAMVDSVARTAGQFGRINRLLMILLRRQSRIPYQYDVIDDCVYFRVRLLRNNKGGFDSANLMRYFSFDIEDLSGWCGINCCSVTSVGDVMQFRVRLLSVNEDRPWSALFSYFSRQSECLLKKLPRRSSVATYPIPMLDEFQVMNDIFQRYENDGL